ncbi:MAG: hypothetical protein GY800_02070 [Planctomycetes bacterium]|nr:hypothetical protein [Planctomycetota bacterium]
MLDWKRFKVTGRNNRIVIICFHVLIAIKIISRFTTPQIPGWDAIVCWTTFSIPIAAGLMTTWLVYYYIYRSAGKTAG